MGSMTWILISIKGRFYSSLPHPEKLWHPFSFIMGYQHFLPADEVGWNLKTITQIHIVPSLRIYRYFHTPSYQKIIKFWSCSREHEML
jgi:hypothetical protein